MHLYSSPHGACMPGVPCIPLHKQTTSSIATCKLQVKLFGDWRPWQCCGRLDDFSDELDWVLVVVLYSFELICLVSALSIRSVTHHGSPD